MAVFLVIWIYQVLSYLGLHISCHLCFRCPLHFSLFCLCLFIFRFQHKFFLFYFFNWKIIALQSFVIFCHTSESINHRYTLLSVIWYSQMGLSTWQFSLLFFLRICHSYNFSGDSFSSVSPTVKCEIINCVCLIHLDPGIQLIVKTCSEYFLNELSDLSVEYLSIKWNNGN